MSTFTMYQDEGRRRSLRRSKRLSVDPGTEEAWPQPVRAALGDISNQRSVENQGGQGEKGVWKAGRQPRRPRERSARSATRMMTRSQSKVPMRMVLAKEDLSLGQQQLFGGEDQYGLMSDDTEDEEEEMELNQDADKIARFNRELASRQQVQYQQPGGAALRDPSFQYMGTMHAQLRRLEAKYTPRADYMESVQADINHQMRAILVDWLVEVAEEYSLSLQTWHLTIHYVDRLLELIQVNRTKLQLVGITAMLVASKYEEIYPPTVEDFVYISDNTYRRDEVLRMEGVLLNSLKFCLSVATPLDFCQQYLSSSPMDAPEPVRHLMNLLCENFAQTPEYLAYRPSVVAAAAFWLAHYSHNMREERWPKAVQQCCGYTEADIAACVAAMHAAWRTLQQPAAATKAVREKYTRADKSGAATVRSPDLPPHISKRGKGY